MGLGSTAQKIQKLADTAETLYKQLQNVQERLIRVENSAMETGETVDELEDELAEQRAILAAIAEEHGIDHETVAADALITDAEDAVEPTDDAAASTTDPAEDGGETTGTVDGETEKK